MHIYQKETKSAFWRDTDFAPMFIAAFPTVAKIWKLSKCPSVDDWTQKMWCIQYIHTVK